MSLTRIGPRHNVAFRAQRRERKLATTQGDSRWLAVATIGLLATSAAWLVGAAFRVTIYDPAALPAVIAGTVAYLPLHLRHVWDAAHGRRPRSAPWTLTALAVIVFGLLPLIGPQWTGALYPLAASTLLMLRPPWSYSTFAALVLAPLPISVVIADLSWGNYFAVGVALYGVLVSVPAWLIATARELNATRAALAEKAVVRERLRIDAELRATIGTALETISAAGTRASAAAPGDTAVADELRAMLSRRTLAAVRRTVRRYSQPEPAGELDNAAALLRAAGIEVTMPVSTRDLRDAARTGEFATVLRAEVMRALGDETLRGGAMTMRVINGAARLRSEARDEAGA